MDPSTEKKIIRLVDMAIQGEPVQEEIDEEVLSTFNFSQDEKDIIWKATEK